MKGDGEFVITKDDSLKAVYSSDLDAFLERLGLSDEFIQGHISCRYCRGAISKRNLYAIIPVNNKVDFCCNQPECIISLSEEASK